MRAGMGDLFAGVFGNDDNWRDAIVDAGTAVGDLAWPWPMHRRYERLLESRVADLRNTSGRPYGYPITAATFLQRFAGEGAVGARRHARARAPRRRPRRRVRAGASGYGVRLLVEVASRLGRRRPEGRKAGERPRRVQTPAGRRRRRPPRRPVGELVRLRRLAGRDDDVVVRREPADGIGGRGVAGEAERLAAAAAPVLLLPAERTRAARLLHPVGAAEARERVRLVPDPVECVVARRSGRSRLGDRRRGLARERVAVRRDDDRGPPPAAHARLRQVLVVVREDPEHVDPRSDARAEPLHRRLAALELRARRHERLLVERRPPVVLRVRELEPLRVELLREPEDLLDPVEVLAVQDAVDREREAQLARRARGRDLLLERPVAGDPVVLLGIGALDRDLDVVEPRRLQLHGALAREERARGHERRVQAGRAPGGHELVEVAAQHRLAAGQRELHDAQRPRLAEHARPVLRRRARRGSGRRRCRRDSSSTGSAAGTGRRAPRRACRA